VGFFGCLVFVTLNKVKSLAVPVILSAAKNLALRIPMQDPSVVPSSGLTKNCSDPILDIYPYTAHIPGSLFVYYVLTLSQQPPLAY